MLLNIEAHCLDDETIARFREKGIEVEDATQAPWQVLFRGSETVLRELLAADWGLSSEDIELAIANASDTDLDVRAATKELIAAAANMNELDDGMEAIQKAIGVKYYDIALHFIAHEDIAEWSQLTIERRCDFFERYVAAERRMYYPEGFDSQDVADH